MQEFKFLAERIGQVSDGYHTFDELYEQRFYLFAALCHAHRDKAWKSLRHDDMTMYDNYFIAGIDTPEGQFTYHYPMELFSLLDVQTIGKAPKWDGHTAKDVTRLLSL